MKVLVVGSGGREHALCWKLRQSSLLEDLYCAPGNPGIDQIADPVPVSPDEIQKLAGFAAEIGIDLTIVGPELPLALGLADEFASRGLAVFGPRQAAARLESSKVYAKQFMDRHGIPTTAFRVTHDADETRRAARELGLPVVLKADGLAAGKGVIVVRTGEELESSLEIFFGERRFGSAGDRVVVEECLDGEEVSMIALADGRSLLALAPSKDYKRIGEGDEGPNTGGMGSHSPSGVLSRDEAVAIRDDIMTPVVEGMARDNAPFVGVLYTGLMLTSDGPKVLEFNVRFGDPEAQSLLLRLEDDLLPVLAAAAAGELPSAHLKFRKEAAACIVLAAPGYPGPPVTGDRITGLEEAAGHRGVEVFHAATALRGDELVTAGGRVLNVCALGADLAEALRRAYAACAEIRWDGKVMRRDIGRRVLEGGLRKRPARPI